MSTPKTLYDKIWNDHLVSENEDGTSIIYIDRHLVHEVTSPQAFEGLKIANRSVRKPNFTLATADHNIPTTCLLYTSPSPRDLSTSRMPSSA